MGADSRDFLCGVEALVMDGETGWTWQRRSQVQTLRRVLRLAEGLNSSGNVINDIRSLVDYSKELLDRGFLEFLTEEATQERRSHGRQAEDVSGLQA
jgi:hypothetical protein